jgi:WD40 repeat protein
VTGSNDTTVRVWQRGGGEQCTVLREAKKEVSACAISPDGTLLAVAGTETAIRLYSLTDAAPAGTIPQIPGKPAALAFSDDGLAIAAGYDTGTLAFYDVHRRALIRTIAAHAGAVTGIVALRGGDCVATGGADGMIRTFRFPFMRPLAGSTLADLTSARELALAAGDGAMAEQWRFLCHLLSIRFQNEIELCPVFRDAGQYDIQIVG